MSMILSTVSEGNKLVFERAPFFEVYYFKVCASDASWSFWCRYTLLLPKDRDQPREASLWGVFTSRDAPPVALKKTYALDSLEIRHRDAFICFEDNILSLDKCQGELSEIGAKLKWNLQFEDPTLSGKLYPHEALYRGKFPKTKYLGPRLSTHVSGSIQVGSKHISLDHQKAHQGHIWGTQYAHSWAWAQANQFDDEDLIFEGLTARIPLGPWVSPQISLFHFYYRGVYYPANKIRQWFGASSRYNLQGWHFEIESGDLKFIGTIRRELESIVGVTYTGPLGEKRYCHNSSRAKIDLALYFRGKSPEFIKKFEAKPCAFETVAATPDERVKFLI